MDANSTVQHTTAVVATLDGVTTVLVGFLFVCLIFPRMVKNRPQYYAALAAVIGIILLHTLTLMFGSAGIMTFAAVFTGLLQIGALILLVLSVGGLSVRELAGEMADAYEVIRRGETQKEVVIPIAGQMKKRPGAATASTLDEDEEEDEHKVFHIDSGPTGTEPHKPGEEDRSSSIPLE